MLAGGEYIDEAQCYKLSLVQEPREPKGGGKQGTGSSPSPAPSQSGKNSRKSAAVKRKEELNKQNQTVQKLFLTEPKTQQASKSPATSPPLSPSTCGQQQQQQHQQQQQLQIPSGATSPGGTSPTTPRRKSGDLTMDDLVDCLLAGNSEIVENYFNNLKDKTVEEKDNLRVQLMTMLEQRMESRGSAGSEQRSIHSLSFSSEDADDDEIPYQHLVGLLLEGNINEYEEFFEEMDIYEAEKIREHATQLFEEQVARTRALSK